MPLYTRRQLLLILLLTGAAAAGLGIDRWRRARPDLVERLETVDRTARRDPASEAARTSGRRTRPGAPTRPLDLNVASEVELAGLPGVGPALASRIVGERPFAEVEELRRVRGLRRTTLERIRPLVTTGP